jgi:hypothetical protein
MGMFGFLKKKQPDQMPSPPQVPAAPGSPPAFDMPDIKFDFQSSMDTPPMPQTIQQPSNAPVREQATWSFDTKAPIDRYPLPPETPQKPMAAPPTKPEMIDVPPIKPLKFDDFPMPKRSQFDEPPLEEPFLEKPEDEETGTEPPGIAPDEVPEVPAKVARPAEPEPNFDFDDSEFSFEDDKPVPLKAPQKPVVRDISQPREITPPPKPIARRVIDRDLYINVEDFRTIANLVGSLGDETKMSEEGLLRIKDVTLGKEKVYDKWQNDLEQIEKELIQLDKVLFKM